MKIKKIRHIRFVLNNKKFKQLHKIHRLATDKFFLLSSLYNDCKEINKYSNTDFVLSYITQLDNLIKNIDCRIMYKFYSLSFDEITLDYIDRSNITYKCPQPADKLSIKKSEQLSFGNIIKTSEKIFKNIKSDYSRFIELQDVLRIKFKEKRKEIFSWSRSLNSEILNLILLGSSIWLEKHPDKWVIYDNENILIDAINPSFSLSQIENLIVNYFKENNIDYNHLIYNDNQDQEYIEYLVL